MTTESKNEAQALPPDAAAAESRWELRILAGPQAGARMALGEGLYRVGTADECDILIVGAQVAPVSAMLAIEAARVRFSGGQEEWAMDDEPVGTQEVHLAASTQMRLGEVVLSVEPAHAPWRAARPARTLAGPQLELAADPAAAPVSVSRANRRRRRAGPGWLFGALAAALCFCTWVWAGGSAAYPWIDTAGSAPPAPDAVKPLEDLLARQPWGGGLTVAGNPLAITGCLPTREALAQLKEVLKAARMTAALNVQADDALLAATRNFLAGSERDWKVKAVECGVVTLAGPRDEQARSALVSTMPAAVSGVKTVRFAAYNAVDAAEVLRRLLADAGLSARIDVAAAAGKPLTLSGSLAAADRPRLERVLSEYLQEVGNDVKFTAQFAPVAAVPKPFHLAGIVGGPLPHVITDNGTVLFAGSSYEGYQVAAIEPHHAVFTGPRTVEFAW